MHKYWKLEVAVFWPHARQVYVRVCACVFVCVCVCVVFWSHARSLDALPGHIVNFEPFRSIRALCLRNVFVIVGYIWKRFVNFE